MDTGQIPSGLHEPLTYFAIVMLFAFCFGDGIDRACIEAALIFALSIAGGDKGKPDA